MDNSTDVIQNIPHSNLSYYKNKRKCLTISEYNSMNNFIDSLIFDDNNDFILNKFDCLSVKVINEYPHLHENTVLSIVDARVQHYVRQRHHKVFNNTSNTNSPAKNQNLTVTPNSNNSQSNYNKRLMKHSKTMYDKYKELVDNDSVTSPLTTLANNLRMPAMLVAKVVLSDQMNEEKLRQQSFSESLNSDIMNDSDSVLNNSNLSNDKNAQDNSVTTDLDTSLNIDMQLSQQLNWLTKKIHSMRKILPIDVLNQSSSSNSYNLPAASKSDNLSTYQLATSTWLIQSDPQLAYQVYICSLIDGFYGSCVEFIKSCTGKRYEQFLKKSMTQITTDDKLQRNKLDRNSLYTTEQQCRLRGLDMTPDMVLNEPIAITLTDDNYTQDDQEYIAKNYIVGDNKEVRVLNWIESKAMFGGPEQLRTAMQRQLFPYWNRYGPGAVIYWFGHILRDNENYYGIHADTGVSSNKLPIDSITAENVNISINTDLSESSAFNFWSKYCLLMDGFPSANKIIMHDYRNNSQ